MITEEICINEEPWFGRVQIWYLCNRGGKRVILQMDGTEEEYWVEYVPGSDVRSIKPTITMSRVFYELFIDTIAKKGIKTTTQSFTEGKLEAMGEHLKDMRALVFDKPEIINVENRS